MDEVLTHARSGLETTTDEMEIAEMRSSENKCTTTATSKPQDSSAKNNLHENGDGRYHGERFDESSQKQKGKREAPGCDSFEPRRYTEKLRGRPLRSDSWFASFSAETERSSRSGQQLDWMNDAQVAQ